MLVRVQAHMLARGVVEIRAEDIAVELELWYTVMSSMLTTPTSFPVAPECLYFKSFLSYHGNFVHVYVRTYQQVRTYVHVYK